MDAETASLCIAALRSGRPLTLVNLSPSMSPFVRVGDALTIDPAEPLRPGAMVAVERHGRVVVHRLLSMSPGRVVLRGDANAMADAPDGFEAVLGVVTVRRTRAGRTIDQRSVVSRFLGRLLPRVVRACRRLLTKRAPRAGRW
jgi:hypothetical protein